MKRPEYVAVVTKVYAAAIREEREPTAAELKELQDAFSRSGFTQGYFLDEKGPHMFGTRTETEAPEALYAAARESYRREAPLVPVTLAATLRAGQPCALEVRDGAGHTLQVQGPSPEAARSRETTAEEVRDQLSKTGGTPYAVQDLAVELDPGLAVPKSLLNQLRREALEGLTAQRARPPQRRVLEGADCPAALGGEVSPERTEFGFTLRCLDQLTPELWSLPHRFIDLPACEMARDPDRVRGALAQGARLRVALPRICWDGESADLKRTLETVRGLGVQDALVPTWDRVAPARELGFALHGDFGLGVYNSQTVRELKTMGFASATASFELKLPRVRDLARDLALEAIVYGRLPLMMLEQAPGGVETDHLTDRLGVAFPLLPAPGERYELLNSQILYLADKPEWKTLGLSSLRLLFTGESPQRCVQLALEYQNGGQPPKNFTRGLYYRDVE